MQDTLFSYEDLISIYQNQIAASYEKTFGNTLLGDELSCLSFWLLHDQDRKGFLSLQESKPLFTSFKFPGEITDSLAAFRTEFKFQLSSKKREILEEEPIVRFDFVRDTFLERGL